MSQMVKFLIVYHGTPHASTKASPSELSLKKLLKTHLDLLRLNVESVVCLSQAKQKIQHDTLITGRVIQWKNIMAKYFQAGAPCCPVQLQSH